MRGILRAVDPALANTLEQVVLCCSQLVAEGVRAGEQSQAEQGNLQAHGRRLKAEPWQHNLPVDGIIPGLGCSEIGWKQGHQASLRVWFLTSAFCMSFPPPSVLLPCGGRKGKAFLA